MKGKFIAVSLVAALGGTGVVNAAELDVLVKATLTGDDVVEIVATNDDADLKWISANVKDENGNVIWLGEKRPNTNENLKFNFTASDVKTRTYTATVSFVDMNNEVTQCVKEFTYYSYAEIQEAITKVLAKEKSFADVKDILALTFNELYTTVNNDSLIVDEMNEILKDNGVIEQSDFLDAFDKAVVKAALKNKNTKTVEFIINNYSETVGLTSDLKEKVWYDGLSTKSNVIERLAQHEYEDYDAFKETFRGYVFLEKTAAQHSSKIISFLREESGNSYKYLDGQAFSLDFDKFDATLTTTAKKDYAGVLLAQSGYDKSSLEALKQSFDNAITNAKNYTPPASNESSKNDSSSGTGGGGMSYGVPIVKNPTNESAKDDTASDAKDGFADISEAEWARTDIEYCLKNGIINGKDENKFCPNDVITREEFTAIIARAFQLQPDGDVDFKDVDKGMWYYDSIRAAYHNGLVEGSGENFGIGENITRQDMAVIMYRIAKSVGLPLDAKTDSVFDDIDLCADYAKEAVDTMYKAGYINGVGDGIYQPLQNATRAQAVVLICNLLGR